MSKNITDELKGSKAEWTAFFKDIAKTLPKILVLLVGALLIGTAVFIGATVSFADKISDPNNTEFVTMASAIPLVVCTFNELDKNEAAFDELEEFVKAVSQKGKKCGKSLDDAIECYQEADIALDNPLTVWEMLKKGKRLYEAQDKLKKIIARALARAKKIEPYDDDSAALKDEVISLLTYVNNNASILNVIKNDKEIEAELERRFKEIQNSKNLESVVQHMKDKYPELATAYIADKLEIHDIWKAIAGDKIRQAEPFMRSEYFVRELNGGCLPRLNDDKVDNLNSWTFALFL